MMQQQKKQISALEETSLQPRSWSMSGEVSSSMRPENSLLEEHLTFDHTSRTAPEITEETTMKLENIIKQRIKDKAWDDVIRTKRMKEEVFEFKKRIQLDQEKNKMSLSQIYKQDYLKQQAARTKGEVKGKTERTGTDKNRERKKKKKDQRKRQKEKEKWQKAMAKN